MDDDTGEVTDDRCGDGAAQASPGKDAADLDQRIRELRAKGLSKAQIRAALGVGGTRLARALRDTEPPAWTRRPNAKDELRAKARELRLAGWSMPKIAVEIGVSRSSVSLWTRDLPKPPRSTWEPHRQAAAYAAHWVPELARRQEERERRAAEGAQSVGELSERELLLLGAMAYWCEGSKSKSYARREKLVFMNSDPRLVLLYLRWLRLLGVTAERLRIHVHVHESADVEGIERFWRDTTGLSERFGKTILKRHKPETNRKNRHDEYRGCLMIGVLQSAALYQTVAGMFDALASAVGPWRA